MSALSLSFAPLKRVLLAGSCSALLSAGLLSACTFPEPRPDPGEQRAQDSVDLLVQDLQGYVRSGDIRIGGSDVFEEPATIGNIEKFIENPPYQYYPYRSDASYRIISETTTETTGEFLVASYAVAEETTISNTRWEGRVCARLDVKVGPEPSAISTPVDCPPKTPEERPPRQPAGW